MIANSGPRTFVIDRSKTAFPYSNGLFRLDPAEQLVGVLMAPARPSRPLKLRQKFAALVYSAIID